MIIRFTEINVGQIEFDVSEVDLTGLDAPEDQREALRDYADSLRVEGQRGLTWISTTVEYIVAALRPGDILGFHWVASNNSESMRTIGYHHDQLRLSASNPERKNNRHWIIKDQFGPDNSARMVVRNVV